MRLKIFVIKILFFVSISVFGTTKFNTNYYPAFCGWGPSWEDTYYPIIDQYNLVDKENYGFLHCPDEALCDYLGDFKIDYNIEEWYNYFNGKFTKEELQSLVYSKSEDWLKGNISIAPENIALYKKISKTSNQFFKRYLILAKGTANLASDRADAYGWYEGENLKFEDKSPWLEKAIALMEDAPNAFFRNRVGFQIVKLAHYKQDNALAISAFKKYLKLKKHSTYIYYRALEQVSGAYFNIGEYNIAAQNYIEVFHNLPDRRHSCALSLRYIDWSQFINNPETLSKFKHKAVFHFFKAYYNNGDNLKEMKAIAEVNKNSPYLDVLLAREIDAIQSQIFAHDDNSYYYEETDRNSTETFYMNLYEFSKQILEEKNLKSAEKWKLLAALTSLKLKNYEQAKHILNTEDWNVYDSERQRLQFTVSFMSIVNNDRQAIENAFLALKNNKAINTHVPTVTAFFNHISAVYEKENHILSILTALDYSNEYKKQKFSWEGIENGFAYNYRFEVKYPLLEETTIRSFESFLNIKNHTTFETTILNRLKLDPRDFINDLKGTYLLGNNDLKAALNVFKSVKATDQYWNEDVRPELFASSIKEWMNVDFEAISDQFHLNFLDELNLEPIEKWETYDGDDDVKEAYKDNKIKLVKILMLLEELASAHSEKAASYYYMLGNAWYNMSYRGWFINNLYYVTNDYRNDFFTSYSDDYIDGEDDALNLADYYFNKALEAKGDEELMAKITFMLAKTNSCFDMKRNKTTRNYDLVLCDSHEAYFKSLEEDYAGTNYYQDVLKECSWFLAYKLAN